MRGASKSWWVCEEIALEPLNLSWVCEEIPLELTPNFDWFVNKYQHWWGRGRWWSRGFFRQECVSVRAEASSCMWHLGGYFIFVFTFPFYFCGGYVFVAWGIFQNQYPNILFVSWCEWWHHKISLLLLSLGNIEMPVVLFQHPLQVSCDGDAHLSMGPEGPVGKWEVGFWYWPKKLGPLWD